MKIVVSCIVSLGILLTACSNEDKLKVGSESRANTNEEAVGQVEKDKDKVKDNDDASPYNEEMARVAIQKMMNKYPKEAGKNVLQTERRAMDIFHVTTDKVEVQMQFKDAGSGTVEWIMCDWNTGQPLYQSDKWNAYS
ncbi:hypothetical protein P4263_20690 [Bacillus thuringiensis]|nr:hypothetical protein [Bacillus thuringiensis]AKR12558.1 hypothetical protein AC241_27825 [Bacillus thuringiensis]MED2868019.1 hypothetical protein [Bacillus thuringiensis]